MDKTFELTFAIIKGTSRSQIVKQSLKEFSFVCSDSSGGPRWWIHWCTLLLFPAGLPTSGLAWRTFHFLGSGDGCPWRTAKPDWQFHLWWLVGGPWRQQVGDPNELVFLCCCVQDLLGADGGLFFSWILPAWSLRSWTWSCGFDCTTAGVCIASSDAEPDYFASQ